MTLGHATGAATRRYAARFHFDRFFRESPAALTLSSLGIGSYLGQMDTATDTGYREAVIAAVRGGINVIDTSLNYRHQRSERNIGEALETLFASSNERDELVVCTKAGFLVPGAIPPLTDGDVVAKMHSMAPAFLAHQLELSRANLGLETIDVFYLHNPETQLSHISREEFDRRLHAAFECLESLCDAGKIAAYGAATWSGFRTADALSLPRMEAIARDVAGPSHRFRFIQLPFNLGMVEAYSLRVLAEAATLNITVIASATLLQARLARDLPEPVAEIVPEASTDAQRAIQFTRSAPGIAVALVGMSNPAHVAQNLGVTAFPPLALADFERFFA